MATSLSLFIFVVLLISFTSCEDDMSLITPVRKPDTCDTKLSICKLDANKLIGEKGYPGVKGDSGYEGTPGRNGRDGRDGVDGYNGTDGARGSAGPRGFPGLMGDKGLKGDQGRPGPVGPVGAQGEKGSLGPKGDTGPSGTPGTCSCPNDAIATPKVVNKEWGTKEHPGTVTCRNAPLETFDNPSYYLNPGPMEVTCDSESKKTCIKPSTSVNVQDFRGSKPFWLSEKKISVKDIYNLEINQLSWLQSQSYTAELTIRYHCYNSKPLGDSSTAPMILLSWNDLKVGPVSTPSSPFHYSIVKDDCATADKDKWSFTDIKLVSSIAKRIPIIDFFINDVRDEVQAFRIEIVKLCFG